MNVGTPIDQLISHITPCGPKADCSHCLVTPCSESVKIQEAVRLIQAGARATLVQQLIPLPKKLVKRLYTLLNGHYSPRGQMPFSEAWYVENDQRMLHTTLIWQLHQNISRSPLSEGRILLDVYGIYRCIVPYPLLDIARTYFALRLIEMSLFQIRHCHFCNRDFIASANERNDSACPGCRLYHRFRCRRCGASLNARASGRPRTHCEHCT